MVEQSVYTPQTDVVAPIPEWKKRDYYREVLPPRDRIPDEEN